MGHRTPGPDPWFSRTFAGTVLGELCVAGVDGIGDRRRWRDGGSGAMAWRSRGDRAVTVDAVTVDRREAPVAGPLRAPATTAVERLLESTQRLQQQLVAHEDVCHQILTDVRGDVPIDSLLAEVGADRWRSSVTNAVQSFEMSRHALRLVLVAMAVADGMSIAEIARTWGVSRQLASRWVRETREMTDPRDLPD